MQNVPGGWIPCLYFSRTKNPTVYQIPAVLWSHFRYVGSDLPQEESPQWETTGWCQNCWLHSHHCPDCRKSFRRLKWSKRWGKPDMASIITHSRLNAFKTQRLRITQSSSCHLIFHLELFYLIALLPSFLCASRCWLRLWWPSALSAAGLHATFIPRRTKWQRLSPRRVSGRKEGRGVRMREAEGFAVLCDSCEPSRSLPRQHPGRSGNRSVAMFNGTTTLAR